MGTGGTRPALRSIIRPQDGVPSPSGVICKPTVDEIASTLPVGDAHYCIEIAYATDNPGYNADASPAPKLKKVFRQFGNKCG